MLNYIAENMPFEENDQDGNDEADEENEGEDDGDDDDGYYEKYGGPSVEQGSTFSNDDDMESNIRKYFENEDDVVNMADNDVGYQSEDYQDDNYEVEEEEEDGDEEGGEDQDEEEGDEENEGEEEEDDEEQYEEDEEAEANRLRELEAVEEAFNEILCSPRVQQYIEKKQMSEIKSKAAAQSGDDQSQRRPSEEDEEDASVAEDLLHIMNDYSELMTYLQSPRGPGSDHATSNSKLKTIRQHIKDSPPRNPRQQPAQQQALTVVKAKPSSKPKQKKPAQKNNKFPAKKAPPPHAISSHANPWNESNAVAYPEEDRGGGSDSDDFLQPVKLKKKKNPQAGGSKKPAAAAVSSKAKTEAGNKLKVCSAVTVVLVFLHGC